MRSQDRPHASSFSKFPRLSARLLDTAKNLSRRAAAAEPGDRKGRVARTLVPGLSVLLLLLVSGQSKLFAQQAWPQGGAYGSQYPQQYAPDQSYGYQQPGYPQPGYAQQQPYGQAQYPPQQQSYYPQQPYPQQQPYPASGQAYAQQGYDQQGQGFNADQLEQLVAPIALYPDPLVALMLAAATYPAQVADADRWRQAQGYASPYQIAAGANAAPWDPSVKALTAFPQVLAEMDRNSNWTTDLGNAYYNQPQDVLEAVQIMRQRAQAAGTLENSPQEAVSYNQGNIELAAANPQMVYVPSYNPWAAYGQPVNPYPGFSLLDTLGSFVGPALRFGLGTAMTAFTNSPWGWLGWGLDWLSQTLLFHQSSYYSHSTSVANWGLHGGMHAFAATRMAASNRMQNNYGRANSGYNTTRGYSTPRGEAFAASPARTAANRGYQTAPVGYARVSQQQAYNRVQSPVSRPQQYSRPAYGSSFYGSSNRGYSTAYSSRPATSYGSTMQSYRQPTTSASRSGFGDSRAQSSAFAGRGDSGFSNEQARSGGLHLFGDSHSSRSSENFYGGSRASNSYKAPKMPKMHASKSFSGGHSHGGGGGHGGGHHHFL